MVSFREVGCVRGPHDGVWGRGDASLGLVSPTDAFRVDSAGECHHVRIVTIVSESTTGWTFVAAQAILLVGLVLLPEGDDWPTPGWVEVAAFVLIGFGVVLVAIAGRWLGSALTPTPVPRRGAALATHGLYAHVRHPIYSGVLLIVVGFVLGSGSVFGLLVGAVAVVFFGVKAAWEEQRLRAIHPEYATYAAVTPRFVPRPWR